MAPETDTRLIILDRDEGQALSDNLLLLFGVPGTLTVFGARADRVRALMQLGIVAFDNSDNKRRLDGLEAITSEIQIHEIPSWLDNPDAAAAGVSIRVFNQGDSITPAQIQGFAYAASVTVGSNDNYGIYLRVAVGRTLTNARVMVDYPETDDDEVIGASGWRQVAQDAQYTYYERYHVSTGTAFSGLVERSVVQTQISSAVRHLRWVGELSNVSILAAIPPASADVADSGLYIQPTDQGLVQRTLPDSADQQARAGVASNQQDIAQNASAIQGNTANIASNTNLLAGIRGREDTIPYGNIQVYPAGIPGRAFPSKFTVRGIDKFTSRTLSGAALLVAGVTKQAPGQLGQSSWAFEIELTDIERENASNSLSASDTSVGMTVVLTFDDGTAHRHLLPFLVNNAAFATEAALPPGSVDADALANNAVITAKVGDQQITLAKLAAAVAAQLVPAGGTAAQYVRGDNTLATFPTAITPELVGLQDVSLGANANSVSVLVNTSLSSVATLVLALSAGGGRPGSGIRLKAGSYQLTFMGDVDATGERFNPMFSVTGARVGGDTPPVYFRGTTGEDSAVWHMSLALPSDSDLTFSARQGQYSTQVGGIGGAGTISDLRLLIQPLGIG